MYYSAKETIQGFDAQY